MLPIHFLLFGRPPCSTRRLHLPELRHGDAMAGASLRMSSDPRLHAQGGRIDFLPRLTGSNAADAPLNPLPPGPGMDVDGRLPLTETHMYLWLLMVAAGTGSLGACGWDLRA
jgi:hypothetical protein